MKSDGMINANREITYEGAYSIACGLALVQDLSIEPIKVSFFLGSDNLEVSYTDGNFIAGVQYTITTCPITITINSFDKIPLFSSQKSIKLEPQSGRFE